MSEAPARIQAIADIRPIIPTLAAAARWIIVPPQLGYNRRVDRPTGVPALVSSSPERIFLVVAPATVHSGGPELTR